MENMKSCRCMHHSMTSILVVLIALAFLLGNIGMVDAYTVGMIWPVLLGLIGLQKVFSRRCKCCSSHCDTTSSSESGQCGVKY